MGEESDKCGVGPNGVSWGRLSQLIELVSIDGSGRRSLPSGPVVKRRIQCLQSRWKMPGNFHERSINSSTIWNKRRSSCLMNGVCVYKAKLKKRRKFCVTLYRFHHNTDLTVSFNIQFWWRASDTPAHRFTCQSGGMLNPNTSRR